MVDVLKITLVLQVFKIDVCGKVKQILCSVLWSLLYNATLIFILYIIFSALEMQICTHSYKIMLILSGDPVCQIMQLDCCHGRDL